MPLVVSKHFSDEHFHVLAAAPLKFAVCDVCSRAALIATLVGVWLTGGLLTVPSARWLISAPAALATSLCTVDFYMAWRRGAAAWAVHRMGRVAACANAVCLLHLMASAIVLRLHPYGSFFVHVAGCAAVAACTVPQLHVAVLAGAMQQPQNSGVPQLDVRRHVVFQACVRAFRFIDCATGVTSCDARCAQRLSVSSLCRSLTRLCKRE